MTKFTADIHLPPDNAKPYRYGNLYFRETTPHFDRLVVGPSKGHVRLMERLADAFPTQRYTVLYVLLVSHAGREHGRYQSPVIESRRELRRFLARYRRFFETDGRHHVWLVSPDSGDMIIYDNHNILYLYGNIDLFAKMLGRHRMSIREFDIPYPHAHYYNPKHVAQEDAVLNEMAWQFSEYVSGDE